jgi:hypothetical protein
MCYCFLLLLFAFCFLCLALYDVRKLELCFVVGCWIPPRIPTTYLSKLVIRHSSNLQYFYLWIQH